MSRIAGHFGKVYQAVLDYPEQKFTRKVAVKTVKGKSMVENSYQPFSSIINIIEIIPLAKLL